jgi:chaperone required for assembly of F1-ATPase
MKRFWQAATAVPVADGHGVALDGRPVRTPAGRPLLLPTADLASAVAAEWQAVDSELRPADMPLTGLANAAVDIVADDPAGFAASLARYAESDLLCYRAEHPPALVARQAAAWDPPLDWARRRFDIGFEVTAGIVHRPQPAVALARIGAAYAAFPPFALAALSPLVSISGSAVLPLALADGALDAEAAWAAALLDELFQAEQWGEDALAAASRADRARQFHAAAHFLALSSQGQAEPLKSNRGDRPQPRP